MGSLKEAIRHETDIVSRRQAKSIHCIILSGRVLTFMYKHNLIPQGVWLDYESGYDEVNGYLLALPISKKKQYLEMQSRIGLLKPVVVPTETEAIDPNVTTRLQERIGANEERLTKQLLAEQGLIQFLNDTVLLITITRSKGPNDKSPHAEHHDVHVESQDLTQAIQGELVAKTIQESSFRRKALP